MSDGPILEAPRHVELAQIDEDVRALAIDRARSVICVYCPASHRPPRSAFRWDTRNTFGGEEIVARALRVLRHYGLLVEHGDGVVSVKEQA